jgi:hypothetical protein
MCACGTSAGFAEPQSREITAKHIHAELGELVGGSRVGRESAHVMMLSKSADVAMHTAAVVLVLRAIRQQNVGTTPRIWPSGGFPRRQDSHSLSRNLAIVTGLGRRAGSRPSTRCAAEDGPAAHARQSSWRVRPT